MSAVNLWSVLKSIKPHSFSQDDIFEYNEFDSTTITTSNGTITTMIENESKNDMPYLSMYGSHRAEESFELLPEWLQTYFEWHGEQTRNPTNDTKYVVLSCLRLCGGVSDRLRTLPFFLLYASLVPRVVCIHWPTPFGLENYLVPPIYGGGRVVDWRCPPDVTASYPKVHTKQALIENNVAFDVHCRHSYLECYGNSIQEMKKSNDKFVFLDLMRHAAEKINIANNIFQLNTYTDKMPLIGGWQFVDLMGDIFRVMFEPVSELTRSINNTMTRLALKENEYVSVHVRSRYPALNNKKLEQIDKGGNLDFEELSSYLRPIVNNAIKCAYLLAPNNTILFLSDNHEVTRDTITGDISVEGGVLVRPIGIDRDKEPLHSDGTHPDSQISDFYPIFEDLLIMGGSKCVAHGMGSFGAFGAGLIGNRCRAIHRIYNGNSVACPNDRSKSPCIPTNETYGGKKLFGSVMDGKGRLSCDSLDAANDIKISSN